MLIENLESRTYFGGFSCTLKNGVLTVTGTDKADVISVNNISSKTINVGASNVAGQTYSKNFNTSAVKKVKILAKGEADYVTCHSLAKSVQLTIDGGGGDDILQGSLFGKNTIIGGSGKDILSAGTGGCTFEAKGDKYKDSITAYKKDIVHADKTDSVTNLG
jgi:hypothetical protein